MNRPSEKSLAAVRLLATDLDGTLLDERSEVRDDVARSIGELIEGGVRVVFATGRRWASTKRFLRQLSLVGPAVVDNGARVADAETGRTLWGERLGAASCEVLLSILRELELGPLVYYDAPEGPTEIAFERASPDPGGYIERYSELVAGHIQELDRFEEGGFEEVIRIIVAGPGESLEKARSRIVSQLGDAYRLYLVRDPILDMGRLEILPPGTGKGVGVLHVARGLDLGREAVAAIGDDLNDVDMIEGVRHGYAVSNAHPTLKGVAENVTVGRGPDGFLELAGRILNR